MARLSNLKYGLIVGATVLVILVVAFYGYKYSNIGSRLGLDPVARGIMDQAGIVRSYQAKVVTRAELSDRVVEINGTYTVDTPRERYGAISTTSLTIPGVSESHVFTLENISIGENIYTRLQTNSPLIRQNMPETNGWRNFTSKTIPENFSGIAIRGSISDNLLLLSEQGKYLQFLINVGNDDSFGKTFFRYRFKLSSNSPPPNSTLESIFNRITKDGTIDVWIDLDNKSLVALLFANDSYRSTTTIMHLLDVPEIIAPISNQK
jgi:hypothetical protein